MISYKQYSKKIILSTFTLLILAATPLASQASIYPTSHGSLPLVAQNSRRPPLPPPEDRYSTRPPSPNVSEQKAKSHPEYSIPERQGWDDRGRQDFRRPPHEQPGFEKRPPARPHAPQT